MQFSRQEYWSGLILPSTEDLPKPGIQLTSPALAGGFFTTVLPGKPRKQLCVCFQSLNHAPFCATPWTATSHASLSFTISRSLLKSMSIESLMLSNHLILCHPLFLLSSIFLASGSFSMSWLLSSAGQSIGASASASVLPMNIQGFVPLGLTGLISLQL